MTKDEILKRLTAGETAEVWSSREPWDHGVVKILVKARSLRKPGVVVSVGGNLGGLEIPPDRWHLTEEEALRDAVEQLDDWVQEREDVIEYAEGVILSYREEIKTLEAKVSGNRSDLEAAAPMIAKVRSRYGEMPVDHAVKTIESLYPPDDSDAEVRGRGMDILIQVLAKRLGIEGDPVADWEDLPPGILVEYANLMSKQERYSNE